MMDTKEIKTNLMPLQKKRIYMCVCVYNPNYLLEMLGTCFYK